MSAIEDFEHRIEVAASPTSELRRSALGSDHEAVRLPPPRFVFVTTALSVPLVAGLMWAARRHELSAGLPCEARGAQGCAYDANLAAAYGTAAGFGALCAVAVAHRLTERRPGVASVASMLLLTGWLVFAAILIRGTQS